MPFGLVSAPSTFERCIENVLRGLQWQTCLIYLDDIIIFSQTFEDHLENLTEVFKRIKNAGLKLKSSKCEFLKQMVKFLGHVVSKEGISTDPEKISAVADWPAPTSVTEIRSFLGFVLTIGNLYLDFHILQAHYTTYPEKMSSINGLKIVNLPSTN